jgi:hypothetical protein
LRQNPLHYDHRCKFQDPNYGESNNSNELIKRSVKKKLIKMIFDLSYPANGDSELSLQFVMNGRNKEYPEDSLLQRNRHRTVVWNSKWWRSIVLAGIQWRGNEIVPFLGGETSCWCVGQRAGYQGVQNVDPAQTSVRPNSPFYGWVSYTITQTRKIQKIIVTRPIKKLTDPDILDLEMRNNYYCPFCQKKLLLS